jgi:HK97 family phage prohead protease
MKDGVVDELSIGFNTIKEDWDKEAQVRRHIKEIKLWEFSPVTFAANDHGKHYRQRLKTNVG